ncbi:MAG: hypothetical protein WCB73_24845 [Pseudonocardiaceae bacterium]
MTSSASARSLWCSAVEALVIIAAASRAIRAMVVISSSSPAWMAGGRGSLRSRSVAGGEPAGRGVVAPAQSVWCCAGGSGAV